MANETYQLRIPFQTSEAFPKFMTKKKPPHPIPYQGSKRKLVPHILPLMRGRVVDVLFEPFCGSAAVSLAAASQRVAERFVLNDSLTPLTDLWQEIIRNPAALADRYEEIWNGHIDDSTLHYYNIRKEFNEKPQAATLLYLLTRCVKSAVRFNDKGKFNQSPDKRRLGTRPMRMREEIMSAHEVFNQRTTVMNVDYADCIALAGPSDLVYMDPPWEGTSGNKDTRYHQLLDRPALIKQMELMNIRGVPFILSFDGRLGNKTYGEDLPLELGLVKFEISAGRSSQATLSGRDDETFESLYVSPAISKRSGTHVQKAVAMFGTFDGATIES